MFVDRDAGARQAIAENVASLGLADRCEVLGVDATQLPARRAVEPIDLVFLDPPYTEGLAVPALGAASKSGWFATGALAVVEVGAREVLSAPPGYTVLDERVWGAAKVVFLKAA